MAPSLLLLLLVLLWPQGCLPGAPAENVYTKVRHLEGETLSVQCSYKGRKNPVDGKVWCKIRRKRCDVGFTRIWVQGPRYVLQDDVKAKVVNITMRALTRQDSGRYWCMRNSSGILYPLMGFQLEVSPGEGPAGPLGWVSCISLTSDTMRLLVHQRGCGTIGFPKSFYRHLTGVIFTVCS